MNPSAFRDAVDASQKKRRGENGNPEYTNEGVGSNVLALSQMVRGGCPTKLVRDVLSTGDANDIADLIVLLFVTRNCRGGKGEKKLSHDMFLLLWDKFPATCKKLLGLFPHYGYWKDLLLLMVDAQASRSFSRKDELIDAALGLIKEQLAVDEAAVKQYKFELQKASGQSDVDEMKRAGPEISLLAKWLPRERSAFDEKLGFVDRFLKVSIHETKDNWQSGCKADYRRQVAALTSYLSLPEVLLAAKREDEIRFSKVASRATMVLRNVFLNKDKKGAMRSNDPKRIRLAKRFLSHVVNNGLKGAQLMPHEIVEKILKSRSVSEEEELVYDAQWKDLWRNVVEQVSAKAAEEGSEYVPTHMVPLCDVSPSMSGLPMHVAIALSIGISEITHEAFKNMILTFHSSPSWHRLKSSDSIVKKVQSLARAAWGGSTNFEAAYDLVLKVVESAKLDRSDMPSLIVFSDMQFNEAASFSHKARDPMTTMHNVIRSKVHRTATRLGWNDHTPTPIVYWNLRNTGGHPVDKSTEGSVLLSGFSPSLLKLIMYGDALREEEVILVQEDGTTTATKVRATPAELLRKMLDDDLYDPVRSCLVQSQEGALLHYECSVNAGIDGDKSILDDDDFALVDLT